jgi:hypothetical protein
MLSTKLNVPSPTHPTFPARKEFWKRFHFLNSRSKSLFHTFDQILEEVGAEEMECLLRIRVLVYLAI